MTSTEVTAIVDTTFKVRDYSRGETYTVETANGQYSCTCTRNVAGTSCRHIDTVKRAEARMRAPSLTATPCRDNALPAWSEDDRPFSIWRS